ncbi:MAG: M20/M25/M40 family metallo-hydrolase [Actinomycetota bacterium]|nr:M20/M25/M40 family metallo-hydrolase [Actinomycetota bacterium]
MDPQIAADAAAIAARAPDDLEALVAVSSPSGDVPGGDRAIALCIERLPAAAALERVPCSTAASAPDLIARLQGTGRGRLLLLGHVDTVIDHAAHQPLRRDGGRLYGSGTADMKGGVVLALGVARALSARPHSFAEVSVLLVTDEEWRTSPFLHVDRFAGYDACLCFEAGERTVAGEDAVVVRRKAAGTLRVEATGQASHSGSAPRKGRNALLALAHAAIELAALQDPDGPAQLTVVPTVMRSGDAFNVVPAAGELLCDMRAARLESFDAVLAAMPAEVGGAVLEGRMQRRWPGMDSEAATVPLLQRAGASLGRRVLAAPRGGASDASHFAASIAITVDGLGPRGGGSHTPQEFVLAESLGQRAEVALALADGALLSSS